MYANPGIGTGKSLLRKPPSGNFSRAASRNGLPVIIRSSTSFESEHVTQFLDNSHKRDMIGKWFGLVSVLSAVALFVFLTVFLAPDSPELYVEILKAAIAFAGGMGAGYGLKAYRGRRESA